MGLRAGLEAVAKRKIRGRATGCSSRSNSFQRLSYPGLNFTYTNSSFHVS